MEWRRTSKHFYELRRLAGFEDLEDRVIVEWGRGARSWVQKANDKPVLEILPAGRRLPPFDDYLEFTLSYADLVELFSNEVAHREWRNHLEAVAGVYLILAETTGALYVGSASGEGGVWARWGEYAKTGPCTESASRGVDQQGSHLPERVSLGTRATGLNLN